MDLSSSSRDSADFIRLLTAHQPALRGLITAMLPGSQDIDDILQDTNVVIWEKRKKYDRQAEFKPWVYGIARNKVRQYWGKQKQHASVNFSEEFMEAAADACEAGTTDELRKKRNALTQCLSLLKPRDRELIYASYEARTDLDSRVVKFGMSPGSLRVTAHRIRKKLKDCVEKRLILQGGGA